jgi:hypothetical protein
MKADSTPADTSKTGPYRRNPAVVERRVRNTCLLVPVMSSFEELDSLYSLNATAQFIWSKACDGLDAASIASQLADAYDVPLEVAQADTHAVLSELCALNLLTKTR